MSKGGGAGKVYFVLYLAVVLELLIIIVERDEAEEHLRQKQKEAMKIVESILSQMQSGSGTEGMNTRPQDEITIPPSGINIKEVMGADIKSYRTYTVEVGVTDVTSAITRRELETEKEYEIRLENLVKLANVQEIQYQLFYSPDENPNNAPLFPSESEIKERKLEFNELEPGQTIFAEGSESEWEFLGMTELILDHKATYNNLNTDNIKASDIKPVYPDELKVQVGPLYKPEKTPDDSVFFYSPEKSKLDRTAGGADLQKRAFTVNFEPPANAGWYKLRFFSRTNRILGVKGGENYENISDETTVNIGTVQLSVGDLRQVYKELKMNLDEFEVPSLDNLVADQDLDVFINKIEEVKEKAASRDDAEELQSRINLYAYICKLLAPGQSVNFDQNSGTLEFNVRVITPKPKIADPVVNAPSYVPVFDQIAGVFEFDISPYQGTANVVTGRVIDATGNNVARLDLTPLDQIASLDIPAPVNGGKRLYRASVNEVLPAGNYKIEITHQLSGKSKSEEIDFDVFETGLTEESELALNQRLDVFAYYGYPMAFSVEPKSGGKIRADQFKIFVNTDDNPQREPYSGLAVSQEDAIKLTPESKQVSVKVVWEQPYTENEVVLFDERTVNIKQEAPAIATLRMVYDFSGTAAKIKVRIDNITVSGSATGSKDQPNSRVKVDIGGDPEIQDGLKGYNFTIEPQILEAGENSYSIELELGGELERGQDKLKGTIMVPVRAVAINPVNGVASEAITKQIMIPVDYRPDRGGPRRRR
jgi:hypothetical protein